ncbi:MAG: flagellar hook-basal body complex protein [Clostridiaceae bacterium]|nr:flagellar hook-basal body complex protein [Clostridiaceae bacterium]
MMRSLYSGVSGLKNHQTRMDVIGNNIANVNTAGYKSSRVVFQDIYSQMVKAGAAATETSGGTNPSQIGLGVSLGAIDILHTSAATQRTDNPLDLAIEGDGFFIVNKDGAEATEEENAGYFFTRAGNFYIDSNGDIVNANGLYLIGYSNEDPEATWDEANEDSRAKISVIDPEAEEESATNRYTDISIDETGVIWGVDSNNQKVAFAKISLATFSNVNGLEKEGSSLYIATGSSGAASYAVSGEGGAGKINPGGLEMSNVDLASEFTDMIVTQRGFQAKS